VIWALELFRCSSFTLIVYHISRQTGVLCLSFYCLNHQCHSVLCTHLCFLLWLLVVVVKT